MKPMNQNLLKKFVSSFLLFSNVALAGDVLPKYVASTIRLSEKPEFIRTQKAPDYWAFSPYYQSQQDGAACGIASMTMLVNAARVHEKLKASDALVTQKALVEKIKVDYSRGLTLDKLGEAVKKALAEFSVKTTVEVIHMDGTLAQNKKIRDLLIKNEKSDQNFILANFNQGVYTGDPEGGGHISPVGAFDEKNNQVLVMDVDREYYEPYWVSTEVFIKGMNTEDSASKKNRGLVLVEVF